MATCPYHSKAFYLMGYALRANPSYNCFLPLARAFEPRMARRKPRMTRIFFAVLRVILFIRLIRGSKNGLKIIQSRQTMD